MPPTRPYLDRIPVADEDLLLINVEVHGRDDGEVGRGPLVKVDDELEREVGQLLADGGEDEGAVGGEAEEGPVEGAEDAAARCQAEGAPGAEAATDAVAQGALLVRLAVPRVALDEVAPEAAAPAGAVPVPEELLGLQEGPVTGRESCGPPPYHPQVLRPRLTPLCRTANESWQRGQKKKKGAKTTAAACPCLATSLLPTGTRKLHVSVATAASLASPARARTGTLHTSMTPFWFSAGRQPAR